jgi:hypothetical protein
MPEQDFPEAAAAVAVAVEKSRDGASGAGKPLVVRWLKAFGAFWWDFLVGDTPELFVGVLVALGVLAILVKAYSFNALAVGGFPALVVVMLGASLYRARRAGH